MSALPLVLRQIRYEWIAFWRNPPAAFFSFVFPLLFLVIFNMVFGNSEIRVPGGTARAATFYVPAIAAMSIMNSCFNGLAMGVAIARDAGVLKRVRGTPLPAWAYLAGRIGLVMTVSLLLIAVVVAMGALVYGVRIPTNTMPAFLVTVLISTAACSALGLAMTALIPNADAAPAVVNALTLPLLFISNVFIPSERMPVWVSNVAGVFPLQHISQALQIAFNPFETGSGFAPQHLLIIAVWGVAGMLVALRFFSWEPRR